VVLGEEEIRATKAFGVSRPLTGLEAGTGRM
jgi:hypothetical protein